jgi:hypothetical protein
MMSAPARVFEGSCHCGAIGFAFRSSRVPNSWPIRACQCSFCRRHGARTTSDPAGSVGFRIEGESKLQRYRFGLRTAEFMICKTCGVYVAAVLIAPCGRFATVNINALSELLDVQAATSISYEGESLEQRQDRRERQWTPVVEGA